MEEKKKGKGLKIVLAIFIILFLLTAGTLGYGYTKYKDLKNDNTNLNTKYENTNKDLEKVKSELDKVNKELETAKKAEDESYGSEYAYRLKDISCELKDNVCTKSLKIKYNGKNHDIKITKEFKKDNGSYNIKYYLYEDDKLIDTIKGGYVLKSDYSDITSLINGGEHIYVFNENNIGFLYTITQPTGTPGHSLILYSNGKPVDSVKIDFPSSSFVDKNGNSLDEISNIKFDGDTFSFWALDCNKSKKAVRVNLTFDGKTVTTKTGEVKKGIEASGAENGCYDTTTNNYSK